MNVTISIDLRKSDPFGLDIPRACEAAKNSYRKARDMGVSDYSKPRAHEHRMEQERFLSHAHDCHGVLLAFAKTLGPDVASKVKELRWALETDFKGEKRQSEVTA